MTVIREAEIRVRLVQEQSRLAASGEVAKWAESYREVEKATKDAARAQREIPPAVREAERVTITANTRMAASFREGGEGVLRMVRGLAFLSASGDNELRKLVQSVALAQGAFDIFAGSMKAVINLAPAIRGLAAAFGPVGLAVSALSAAIGVAIIAWDKLAGSAKKAKEEAEAFNKQQELAMKYANQTSESLSAEARDRASIRAVDRERAGVGSPAEQEAQMRAFRDRLVKEQATAAQFEGLRRNESEYLKREFGDKSPRHLEVQEKVRSSENEQLNLLRERAEAEREILRTQQEQLNQRRQQAQEMAAQGGIIGSTGQAAIAGIDRQSEQVVREYNKAMGKLLDAIRIQQEQANQINEEVRQARNANTH